MNTWAWIAVGFGVAYVVLVLVNHGLYWCTETYDPVINPWGSWNWRLLSPLIWQYQLWAGKQKEQRRAAQAIPPLDSMSLHIQQLQKAIQNGALTLNQFRGVSAYAVLSTSAFTSYYHNAREPLPVREQTDTFIGYKTLKVFAHDGKLQFRGVCGNYYGVDATAECRGDAPWKLNYVQYFAAGIRPPAFAPDPDFAPGNHKSPLQGCTCGLYALKEPADDWEYGAFRATVELFGTVIVGEKGYRAERQRILKIEARRECVVCHEVAAGFSTGADGQVVAVCEQHGVLSCASPSELTGKLGTEVRWAA